MGVRDVQLRVISFFFTTRGEGSLSLLRQQLVTGSSLAPIRGVLEKDRSGPALGICVASSDRFVFSRSLVRSLVRPVARFLGPVMGPMAVEGGLRVCD
jgi:hypothetical protein